MRYLKSGVSDIASLLSYHWVAIPLIILATIKLYTVDPNTLLYSIFLILVTILFSARLAIQFILSHKNEFAREFAKQKKFNKVDTD